MDIEQSELDSVAAYCVRVSSTMDDGLAALAAKDLGIVSSCLMQTKASAGRVMARLVQVGANTPDGKEKPPIVPDALKDTDANRQYLKCLRLASDAAKLVDAERGTGDKAAAIARQIHLTEKEIFGLKFERTPS